MFAETTSSYFNRLSRLENKALENGVGDYFLPDLSDIYNDCQCKMQELYFGNANVFLEDTGFYKGEATDEELLEVCKNLGIEYKEYDYKREDSKNYDFSELFAYVDRQFLAMFEDRAEKALKEAELELEKELSK